MEGTRRQCGIQDRLKQVKKCKKWSYRTSVCEQTREEMAGRSLKAEQAASCRCCDMEMICCHAVIVIVVVLIIVAIVINLDFIVVLVVTS